VGLYEYRAEVLRVVDGDTVELSWKDYGDGLIVHTTEAAPLTYRLAGINAYEKSLRYGTTPEEKALGLAATAWLKGEVEGKKVKVKSIKAGAKGGFGRYLAFLFPDGPADAHLDVCSTDCFNRQLLERGWAEVSKYDDGMCYAGLGYPQESE
jgi:endonuclease YncB( thermonuclease family)